MSDLNGVSYLLEGKLATFLCSQNSIEKFCWQAEERTGGGGMKLGYVIANISEKPPCLKLIM